MKSLSSYVLKSMVTIVRIFVLYKPFRFFMVVGLAVFSSGFLLGLRFLYYYMTGDGDGHIQSLILSSILLGVGFQTLLAAFLADILAVNRRLMEYVQYRLKKRECDENECSEDAR
jgi:hypothetical protein